MAGVSPELLAEAKNYLDITWDDPEGDKKLSGMLSRGMRYLDLAAGNKFDYETPDKPQELLFDYVRYVRSNALDEFQTNYLPEIRALQIYKGLGVYD